MFNRKKDLFKQKVKDVECAIWEQEFKVSKSRQIREGIRQDRDRAMEAANQVELKLKSLEPKSDAELEKQKAALLDNASRYEKQMKMIDNQINGVAPNGEDPGEQGILETIAGLVELKQMYKDYIKSL